MDRTEQAPPAHEVAPRYALATESMAWVMAEILERAPLDWDAIEAAYPRLSRGEQLLVRLASYLADRASIAGEPTHALDVEELQRGLDPFTLRRATKAISLATEPRRAL